MQAAVLENVHVQDKAIAIGKAFPTIFVSSFLSFELAVFAAAPLSDQGRHSNQEDDDNAATEPSTHQPVIDILS